MNIAHSKYPPAALPRAMVIVMRETPDGIAYRSITRQQDGRSLIAEYVADYSGHLAMVMGDAGMMAPISVRRIDSRRVEASYMRGFTAAAVSRRVVSRNGVVMTITTTSTDAVQGVRTTVGVYQKAKDQEETPPAVRVRIPNGQSQP